MQLEQLEKEMGDKVKIVKIDVDANKELVEQYQVYGLPTLLLFKDGKVIEGSKREGAIPKPKIVDYLKSFNAV